MLRSSALYKNAAIRRPHRGEKLSLRRPSPMQDDVFANKDDWHGCGCKDDGGAIAAAWDRYSPRGVEGFDLASHELFDGAAPGCDDAMAMPSHIATNHGGEAAKDAGGDPPRTKSAAIDESGRVDVPLMQLLQCHQNARVQLNALASAVAMAWREHTRDAARSHRASMVIQSAVRRWRRERESAIMRRALLLAKKEGGSARIMQHRVRRWLARSSAESAAASRARGDDLRNPPGIERADVTKLRLKWESNDSTPLFPEPEASVDRKIVLAPTPHNTPESKQPSVPRKERKSEQGRKKKLIAAREKMRKLRIECLRLSRRMEELPESSPEWTLSNLERKYVVEELAFLYKESIKRRRGME